MHDYWGTLALTLPVFGVMAVGLVVRLRRWLPDEAEQGLVGLLVNLFYPALILDNVLNNAALRDPGNLGWAPLVGFGTTAGGMVAGYYLGRLMGFTVGGGLRTFALAAGAYNYGFIPMPIMEAIWGRDSWGVLLVHNVGVESAIWTVGILLLSGLSLREGWHKLVNPAVIALVVALVLNLTGAGALLPEVFRKTVGMVAVCAIPLGVLLSGTTLGGCFDHPRELLDVRTVAGSVLLRLVLLPVGFLLLARFLPCPVELKRVIVIEGAMPAAMISLWLARYYGGHPLTAVRVVVGTTVVGLAVIPLWISLGRWFVGV
jgi:predicted permease